MTGKEPPPSIRSVDIAGKEIIISRKAGEAILRGANVFVPGEHVHVRQMMCQHALEHMEDHLRKPLILLWRDAGY